MRLLYNDFDQVFNNIEVEVTVDDSSSQSSSSGDEVSEDDREIKDPYDYEGMGDFPMELLLNDVNETIVDTTRPSQRQIPTVSWTPMEIREREKRKQEQVDRELKEKKSKHQEELIRQEERIKARIQSTLSLQLEQPRSAQGGQICAVCMTQTVETTFNCGHAATCMTCADNLDTCPICRANITSRNRLYLAGLEPEKMET